MTQFLEVDNLIMRFGGLTAVDGLSFKLDHGEIHGLIGPNGAGKTTTFNMISGFYKPSGGQVRLRGESISGLRMHEVARRGVVRTFQHSTLFAEMTVMDNALVGTHMPFRPNIFAAIIGWDKDDREGARARGHQHRLPEFQLARACPPPSMAGRGARAGRAGRTARGGQRRPRNRWW